MGARFRGEFKEGPLLRESVDGCLRDVDEKCWILDDLCAVQGPSNAILEARGRMEADIDRRLEELSAALDAAATFAAVGTRDAATALGEKTARLAALAAARQELEDALALPVASDGGPKALNAAPGGKT